jgi:hypothetical protein
MDQRSSLNLASLRDPGAKRLAHAPVGSSAPAIAALCRSSERGLLGTGLTMENAPAIAFMT